MAMTESLSQPAPAACELRNEQQSGTSGPQTVGAVAHRVHEVTDAAVVAQVPSAPPASPDKLSHGRDASATIAASCDSVSLKGPGRDIPAGQMVRGQKARRHETSLDVMR